MGKLGEINYLRTLSPEEVRGLAHKPFSEPAAARNLQEMAALFSLLPPRPVRLLDLGCGPGWTSLFFARAGHQVVGVDICPDMIRMADEQRRRLGVDNAAFLVRDYEELNFDAEFDVVVFFDSLHHAVDEELALGRAYRALVPGGRLLVLDTDWDSLVWHSRDEARMARVMSAWDEHLAHRDLPRRLPADRLRAYQFRRCPAQLHRGGGRCRAGLERPDQRAARRVRSAGARASWRDAFGTARRALRAAVAPPGDQGPGP